MCHDIPRDISSQNVPEYMVRYLEGGVTSDTEIGPGDRLVVTVRYTPTSEGEATGRVRITSRDVETVLVDIDGTGVPRPVAEIRVTPTNINFGDTTLGETRTADVSIENIGTSTLNVDPLSIRGDESDFAVDDSTTGPFAIEPGDDVVVTILYDPS